MHLVYPATLDIVEDPLNHDSSQLLGCIDTESLPGPFNAVAVTLEAQME